MCYELKLRGIESQRQVDVDKGVTIKGQKIDILVALQVVVELKAVSKLPEVAVAQVLSYLKATRLKRALRINFGEKLLIDGIQRISL